MKEALLKGLTDEQISKVKACKSQEELLKLAKEEGIQLSDEQLEAINGGCHVFNPTGGPMCFECGSKNLISSDGREFTCKKCGFRWRV